MDFEWDDAKNLLNLRKHGIAFEEAQLAFFDRSRVIIADDEHGDNELRFFCLGLVDGNILTVRFTYRNGRIRIFGAGYWRKGKSRYEKENHVHQ